jgi:hypothetical protein
MPVGESFLNKEEPVQEHTEIGWEHSTDELALFILIEGCQCVSEEEELPMLNDKVNKIGISFKAHPSFKSVL